MSNPKERKKRMKRMLLPLLMGGLIFSMELQGQNMETIQLESPDLTRGKNVMQALSERRSTREFSSRMLSMRDLSDLLWAANGVNRPATGGRTAPWAMNRQDVAVYVCMKEGSYRYDARQNRLVPLSAGDVRPVEAPVCLVLVADDGQTWNALDAGIVSQNISLFCAGVGLATVPRATMDKEQLKKALKLGDRQTPFLNHPVGYFKE